MIRVSIRDRKGEKPYRIMDYVKNEDGVEFLEVKDGCQRRKIQLSDFQEQLKKIRSN